MLVAIKMMWYYQKNTALYDNNLSTNLCKKVLSADKLSLLQRGVERFILLCILAVNICCY